MCKSANILVFRSYQCCAGALTILLIFILQILITMDVLTFCAIAMLATIVIGVIASVEPASSCQPKSRHQLMRQGHNHLFHSGPIHDHVLRGKSYRNETTRSYVTCAVFCLQDESCKSFNFCLDDRSCQLNSAVYSQDKSALQPSIGCVYFDEEFHEVNGGRTFHTGTQTQLVSCFTLLGLQYIRDGGFHTGTIIYNSLHILRNTIFILIMPIN